LPTTKKVFIGGILLLGGFVCVASAIRIFMMDKLVHSPDFTWAMAKVFIWSCCEPFVGIVCACLPTYAPLVRRFWRRDASSSYAPEMYASDKSKIGKHANRISRKHGLGSTTLRGDDEIELTVDISAQSQRQANSRDSSKGKVSPEERSEQDHNEIMVTKDFYWSSST